MPAEIDIDALKIFTKSRTNETEYRQKIKTASLNSRFTGSKRKSVLRLVHFRKILIPKDLKLPLTYEFANNNLIGALRHLKKLQYVKSCSYFTLIQK